ncbi:MAG: stage III sporulation protein AB [Oscillospiraceae bacterium]|nr:stage III sporulation protein AB [Oscillospiraceae bacterium]
MLTAALTGNYFADNLKKRTAALKAVGFMLAEISIMIEYNSSDVYEIAEKLSSDSRFNILGFPRELNNLLKEKENDFSFAWNAAVKSCGHGFLTKDDTKFICSLGDNLGKSGVEGQLTNIRLKQKELDILISEAESSFAQKAKLYRSLGVLLGAFVSILLV